MSGFIALAVVLVVYLLLEFRTGRPDGTYLKVHPYRRMMFFIMPKRVDGIVFFDRWVDADALVAYIAKAKERFPCDITHAVVAGVNVALYQAPRMNRFVVGYRLYQRNQRTITFSMKRTKGDKKAKLSAVKMALPDDLTFKAFCEQVNERINVERSGVKTASDVEYDILDKLPRLGLQLVVPFAKTLDYFNLLPRWFIEGDPMYSSVFIANLGSLGMSAGYHHLFEWGNCSEFVMVGKVEEVPVVVDGALATKKRMLLRFTYDERIDDGINAHYGIEWLVRVLEDPERYLGCLDNATTRPIVPPPGADQEGITAAAG